MTSKPRRPKYSRPFPSDQAERAGLDAVGDEQATGLDHVGVEAAAQALVAGDDDHEACGLSARCSRTVSSG